MFKIVAVVFIGILASIGFFDLGQEAYTLAAATARWDPMPTDIARYSVELFKQGGEAIEQVIDRHADVKIARLIYQTSVKRYPGRLIMLCDGARVLARSDRPDAVQ